MREKSIFNRIFKKYKAALLAGMLVLNISYDAFSQQDPHFTQYMFNNQYFNPAFAGTSDYISGMIFYRRQWVGMNGSPVTQNFTGILPFKRKHFAVALNLANDQIGQVKTGTLNINAAFAYYINLKNGRLSFGLGLGFQQYRLDLNKLNTEDNTDGAFTTSGNIYAPDFNFGVFYKTNRYYAGISTTHINNPGRSVSGYEAAKAAVTKRHYYLTAGYTVEVDEKFTVTPSFICRYSESKLINPNFSADFSVKAEYMEMVWLGASYRTSSAIAFFTGLNVGKINPDVFKQNIKIGYAYDVSVGPYPSYNNGSHEIFISFEYAPKVKRMMPKFK